MPTNQPRTSVQTFDLNRVPNWCDYGALYEEVVKEHLSKVRDRPVRCLELGSFMGKSAYILGNLLQENCPPGSHVITVDHCQGSQNERELQWLAYAAGGNYATALVNTVSHSSGWVIPIICSFERFYSVFGVGNHGFDFIFIDGEHTKAAVMNDLTKCCNLFAREGTIIAGHDYTGNWPEVIEAVNAYFGIRHTNRDPKMAFLKASSGTCWSFQMPYYQQCPPQG